MDEQIRCLPDLPKEIIKEYLTPYGIVLLQREFRKVKNMKKNGWKKIKCDDCNKYKWYHNIYQKSIINIDCCAESCCTKYVCRYGCNIKCPNGHYNKNFDCDSVFACKICNKNINPYRYWIGISEKEYEKRYLL